MTRKRSLAVCGAILLFTASAPIAAQSVPCKSLADALLKHETVPYHAYMNRVEGDGAGTAKESEMISTGSVIYTLSHGKWRRSPMTPAMMLEAQRDGADSISRLYKCSHVGAETISGGVAQHYHIQGTGAHPEKEELWLNSSGMVVRMDVVTDADSEDGATHGTMRYEYANIQVPPGAQ